jgi:hypothetical protein
MIKRKAQMRPTETCDGADIEPLWAARANAKLYAFRWPNIFLFTVTGFWGLLAFSGGGRLELAVLAGVILLIYVACLVIYYYLVAINCLYVGSRRGISTCLCRREAQDVFVVRYSMESYDYEIMTSFDISERASGFAISIRQAPPLSQGVRVPLSPLSIYDNPYRGLVFELDEIGVWENESLASQLASTDENMVLSFIAAKTKHMRYLPSVFLADTVFCHREHLELIVGSILSSVRCNKLQKSDAPIETP